MCHVTGRTKYTSCAFVTFACPVGAVLVAWYCCHDFSHLCFSIHEAPDPTGGVRNCVPSLKRMFGVGLAQSVCRERRGRLVTIMSEGHSCCNTTVNCLVEVFQK